jgi:hypothetical protein
VRVDATASRAPATAMSRHFSRKSGGK